MKSTSVRSAPTVPERERLVERTARYRAHDDGVFEFVDFDRLPAFCSFLPGIAGPGGTPLWAMYANRGQGIVSFGVRDKDHAIAEFLPATWAWQLAVLYGFRTFVRVDGQYWEPFAPDAGAPGARRMIVERHGLRVEDADEGTGLAIAVEYCTSTDSPTAALLRTVRIRNRGSRAREVEVLDGLPVVVPAGVSDFSLKKQRRITEAFCRAQVDRNGVATFAPPASTADAADVEIVREATFHAAWSMVRGERRALAPVVDPDRVFGAGNDFGRPRAFLEEEDFSPEPQMLCNRLASAFAHSRTRLAPGEELRIDSCAGHARSRAAAAAFAAGIEGRFDEARGAARRATDAIAAPALAATASRELDGYLLQNQLDNVLRGGRPVMLPSRTGAVPLHLYARRHGDLERDYNDFHLPAWPLSEGPGNYRDILQNRRHDVWFHPAIGDAEIRAFVELLQADGYNPLSVEGYRWRVAEGVDPAELLPEGIGPESRASFRRIATRPFSPGELLLWASENAASIGDRESWLEATLARCDATLSAAPSHEGYWIDHWTYLLDMVETFERVHPERLDEMLFGAPLRWFPAASGLVRADYGDRRLYRLERVDRTSDLAPSCLFARLAALAAIKSLTLDEEARGIEMEAGRPAWNDAMNGLPGMGGSSTNETMELLRLCRWLAERAGGGTKTVSLPSAVAAMVRDAAAIGSAPWDHAAAVRARESFRRALHAGEGAEPVEVATSSLVAMLHDVERRCADGVARSRTADGATVHSYFARGTDGKTAPLPLFLEAQVHLLRLEEGRRAAREIDARVRESELFDRELQMYRLNGSLAECPYGIGRARAFTPGVYENESIWLHMSYKYLLELLRAGLHAEFFRDARTMLVPFMDPATYGRSVYENSSFIAASCCPDPAARGRGFVARLSGSTAEFIHIWRHLTVGDRPFRVRDEELVFRPEPVLPREWFRVEPSTLRLGDAHHDLPANCLACTLPGGTLLVYRNPRRANTWGPECVRPRGFVLDGAEEIEGPALAGERARRLRNGEYARIDALLE